MSLTFKVFQLMFYFGFGFFEMRSHSVTQASLGLAVWLSAWPGAHGKTASASWSWDCRPEPCLTFLDGWRLWGRGCAHTKGRGCVCFKASWRLCCASPHREMEFCFRKMILSMKENFPTTGPLVERLENSFVLFLHSLSFFLTLNCFKESKLLFVH